MGMMTAAPQLLPLLPHSAQVVATALVGVAASAFHLYSPVPEAALGHTV